MKACAGYPYGPLQAHLLIDHEFYILATLLQAEGEVQAGEATTNADDLNLAFLWIVVEKVACKGDARQSVQGL